ncbi:hypothetical protein [Dolichospermum flos-aquae]|uniref:Uncharacterized protein n=1 Tax=Dolichospermum flos-aquae CCAP 1403/13F TaxID=315271 RepID=A0A6H2BWA8_DOLFA|nr:hypothetical protein [Dolichospermum flos-aquae]QJB43463.1 hypothetical protein HGD76_03735 [Dolichospermum flos-aquae CCAP 1403/13F]
MTTKPRDVQILPIGTDTIILRSRSWARLRFEIEYALARFTERYILKYAPFPLKLEN